MKAKIALLCIFLLVLMVPFACAADSTSGSSSTSSSSSSSTSSSSTSQNTDASSLVYVSNVTMEPEVFFPYEQGTISVTLTNAGTSAMGLSGPDILSDKVHIVKQVDWGTMTYVGAGSTVTYKFVVTVDPPDGNRLCTLYYRYKIRKCHPLSADDQGGFRSPHRGHCRSARHVFP